MATITLEVPDDLAMSLNMQPDRIPDLLRRAFSLSAKELPANRQAAAQQPVYREMIALLVAEPTLEELADFKISAVSQDRLDELLDKNQEGSLTDPEKSELDQYSRYRHIMILLKSCARRAIQARPLT
ncbi:MAG: hypothetical protein ACKV2V_17610 [Blastocatellia bacterium]